MPIIIATLGARRVLPDTIDYVPKAGCGTRQFSVSRAQTSLGTSGIKPILFRDDGFWPLETYENLVAAIAGAGFRTWSSPMNAWDKITGGATGIPGTTWTALKSGAWAATEMVGCMIAQIRQGQTQADYYISAAPNILYKPNKTYAAHTPGDNKGTQVHSEMIMAEQLAAFIAKIGSINETPLGFRKDGIPINAQRRGPQRKDLDVEADLFIEKGTMCQGCTGTWDTTIGEKTYRI